MQMEECATRHGVLSENVHRQDECRKCKTRKRRHSTPTTFSGDPRTGTPPKSNIHLLIPRQSRDLGFGFLLVRDQVLLAIEIILMLLLLLWTVHGGTTVCVERVQQAGSLMDNDRVDQPRTVHDGHDQ